MGNNEIKYRRQKKWRSGLLPKRIFFVVLLIPLVCGTYGYLKASETFLNAVFKSWTYYVLNNSEIPENCWQEVARWTAPVMTAGGILYLVLERFSNRIRYLFGGVAVYGATAEAEDILRQLGFRGIQGRDAYLPARKYIFADETGKNVCLYDGMRNKISPKKDVFMRTDLERVYQHPAGSGLRFFNPEENAARSYWEDKDRCLYREAAAAGFKLSVCIIGFGSLGQQLLLQGLQQNVFNRDQQITYHIFGDAEAFRKIHHEIKNISDKVEYHPESWLDAQEVLAAADRIIVTDGEKTLNGVILAVSGKSVDYFTDEIIEPYTEDENYNKIPVRYVPQGRIGKFYWKAEALNVRNIFRETVLADAKQLNLKYHNIYSKEQLEGEEAADKLWRELSPFHQQSNISAADYHRIVRIMLSERGKKAEDLDENDPIVTELSELEHIRWMRFHYINNWTCGERNNAMRVHNLLVPFEALSKEDKDKDKNNILIMKDLKKD